MMTPKGGTKMMMNNCIYKKSYWLTLGEIFYAQTLTEVEIINEKFLPAYIPATTGIYNEDSQSWVSIIGNEAYESYFADESSGTYNDNPYIAKLMTMLYGKFYSHYILEVEDSEISSENVSVGFYHSDNDAFSGKYSHQVAEWGAKLTTILVETKDRYIKLISLYESEKSKLLDPVRNSTTSIRVVGVDDTDSSSSVNRENDTPQTIETNNEFVDDNRYTSLLNKGTSSREHHGTENGHSTLVTDSDSETKMKRLDEIARSLRNLYRDWVNEFEGLFIEGINL